MDSTIIENFGILYRTFVSYTNEFLKDYDISFAQSVIIANIGNHKEISQEQISVRHSIDRAAVARNIKELEKSGYVITKRSSSDKRRKELELTADGQKIYKLITQKNAKRMKKLFKNISEKDSATFFKVLEALADSAN